MIYAQFTKMCDFFDGLGWAQSAFNRKHTKINLLTEGEWKLGRVA